MQLSDPADAHAVARFIQPIDIGGTPRMRERLRRGAIFQLRAGQRGQAVEVALEVVEIDLARGFAPLLRLRIAARDGGDAARFDRRIICGSLRKIPAIHGLTFQFRRERLADLEQAHP